MEKPTILWKACESSFYLLPVGGTMDTAHEITDDEAVEHWVNGSASFGTNANRFVQNYMDGLPLP